MIDLYKGIVQSGVGNLGTSLAQVERKDSGRRHSSRRGNEHANHSAGDGPKPVRAE